MPHVLDNYVTDCIGIEPGVYAPGRNTEVSGDGSVTLEKCRGGKLGIRLFGKSVQDTTTGANLWNQNALEDGFINADGSLGLQDAIMKEKTSDYIPISFQDSIAVSVKILTERSDPSAYAWIGISFYDSNKAFLGRAVTKHFTGSLYGATTYKITNLTYESVAYVRVSTRTYGEYQCMVHYGEAALPYEPYTGGKPSPNPDYAQEIKSVGVRTKNVFDFTKAEDNKYQNSDKYNFSIVNNTNYWISRYVKVKPNTQYKINKIIAAGAFYSNIGTPVGNLVTSNNSFTTPDNCRYIIFNMHKSVLLFQNANELQLEEGNVVTGFEPYGYKTVIKVGGKNLLDVSQFKINSSTTHFSIQYIGNGEIRYEEADGAACSGVEFLQTFPPGKYSLKMDGVARYACTLKLNNNFHENAYWKARGFPYLSDHSNKYKFTANESFKLVSIFDEGSGILKNAQLELGNQISQYEPYKEPQTATVYTKEPLRGIGDYRDILCQKDGVWGVERKVQEFICHGVNDGFFMSSNLSGRKDFRKKITDIITGKGSCNFLKYISGDGAYPSFWTAAGTSRYMIVKMDFSTNAEFNEFLKERYDTGNPVRFIYLTTATVFEPLPEEPQQALNNLKTYQGTTIIEVDSGEIPATIEATYKKKGR